MDGPLQTTTPIEEKHSFSWPGFVVWPVAILLLYALSYGPFEKWQERRIGNSNRYLQLSAKIYVPLGWVYRKTLLHKPLGIYYHMWLPKYFDAKGDEI
jgi:hypothetical protein